MRPKLRCRMEDLREIASRYVDERADLKLAQMRRPIQARGHLTKSELQKVAYWKSPRSHRRVETNKTTFIREITRFAFRSRNERARIEALTLLDGVQWPTASVILHFFHRSPYPILDFRALWTAGLEEPNQYDFDFWWSYVGHCRDLARQADLSMRTLDMALWQYSKENQGLIGRG